MNRTQFRIPILIFLDSSTIPHRRMSRQDSAGYNSGLRTGDIPGYDRSHSAVVTAKKATHVSITSPLEASTLVRTDSPYKQ